MGIEFRNPESQAACAPKEFELWGGRLSLAPGSHYRHDKGIRSPIFVARTTLSGPATFYRSADMVRKFERDLIIATFLESGTIIHKTALERSVRGPAILLWKSGGGYHACMEPDAQRPMVNYQALIPPHMLAALVHPRQLQNIAIPVTAGPGQFAADILRNLFHHGPQIDPKRIDRLLEIFIALLVDCAGSRLETQATHSSMEKYFTRINEYIDRNINGELLTADHIAGQFRISSRYLSLILNHHGTTLSTLINNKRLQLAHTLLRSGRGYRTTEIAALCGFRSLPHFHRLFKAHFGLTPLGLMRDQPSGAPPQPSPPQPPPIA